jgi:hypothetical protein
MLNPIGIQMLKLNPIVVKDPMEELVGGDASPCSWKWMNEMM